MLTHNLRTQKVQLQQKAVSLNVSPYNRHKIIDPYNSQKEPLKLKKQKRLSPLPNIVPSIKNMDNMLTQIDTYYSIKRKDHYQNKNTVEDQLSIDYNDHTYISQQEEAGRKLNQSMDTVESRYRKFLQTTNESERYRTDNNYIKSQYKTYKRLFNLLGTYDQIVSKKHKKNKPYIPTSHIRTLYTQNNISPMLLKYNPNPDKSSIQKNDFYNTNYKSSNSKWTKSIDSSVRRRSSLQNSSDRESFKKENQTNITIRNQTQESKIEVFSVFQTLKKKRARSQKEKNNLFKVNTTQNNNSDSKSRYNINEQLNNSREMLQRMKSDLQIINENEFKIRKFNKTRF